VVQSSSAVTVATIGFVNAGLLNLVQSVWVVFGANLGTTVTGWIVAGIGVKVDVMALALPLLGLGMLAWLLAGERRRLTGLGQAVAGFGAFFLGIGFLQEGFQGLAPLITELELDPGAWLAIPAFVLLGFLLTVVTQSSSAAIAIALTASAGGSVPLILAAAAVIGTNIGTTSTAAFAALGATAPARRVAAAHIVFNLLTGVIALVLLPWLVSLSQIIAGQFSAAADMTVILAVFHTIFNCLGVLAIAGIAGRMIAWLGGLFVTQEERVGRPRFLDETLLGVPELALRALVMESRRMAEIAFDVAKVRVGEPAEARQRVAGLHVGALRIGTEIRATIGRLGGQTLPEEVAGALPDIIRGVQHVEELLRVSAQVEPASLPDGRPREAELMDRMRAMTLDSLHFEAEPAEAGAREAGEAAPLAVIEETYQALKTDLLRSAAGGRIGVTAMETAFQQSRLLRRTAEEALKARRRLEKWSMRVEETAPAPEEQA
jgi:phosphate:Na+ symporter